MQVVFLGTKTPHATCQNLLNGIELANQYCSENRFDTFSDQFGAMSIHQPDVSLVSDIEWFTP